MGNRREEDLILSTIKRVILIVMDSVGVGQLPDADRFNDGGAHTLLHVYEHRGALEIPNLCALGMAKIVAVGCNPPEIIGCYGKMAEQSANKDTTSGHWELAGLVLDSPFPTFLKGFPQNIIDAFEKKIGKKILGNYPSSGTMIIEELGEEHLNTGRPIVYTSADSVFQIAAHEDIIPLEKLYEYCRIARSILSGPHAVGRVIARPFIGVPGKFERHNSARRDFSVRPPAETLLDRLEKKDVSPLVSVKSETFSGTGDSALRFIPKTTKPVWTAPWRLWKIITDKKV